MPNEAWVDSTYTLHAALIVFARDSTASARTTRMFDVALLAVGSSSHSYIRKGPLNRATASST